MLAILSRIFRSRHSHILPKQQQHHHQQTGAQKKLVECETVLKNDFFLVACRDDFIENARLFIFETYCRIHNTISISQLAIKLNMDEERAEEWIVNLIRDARLDAKIDSKAGHVLMTPQVPSIYHQVIEKTKGLSFRSEALAQDIGRGGGNDPHMNFKIQGGDGGQQGGGQQEGGGQRGGERGGGGGQRGGGGERGGGGGGGGGR